jgi:putative membrane protein
VRPRKEPLSTEAIRLDDAQVLGLAAAVNSAQIAHSKLAVGRGHDERVQRFAAAMIAEHERAGRELAGLSARYLLEAADSQLATDFRIRATFSHSELGETTGLDFDRLYLRTQIMAHERALEVLDGDLIPRAENSELRGLLEQLRARAHTHLEHARSLLDALR